MFSTLSLSWQALSSRQAKVVLALVLVAVLVVLAAITAVSLTHGFSFGAQPLACGGSVGPCPESPLR